MVHVDNGFMPFGQNSLLRFLEMGLFQEAMSQVMGPMNVCRFIHGQENESCEENGAYFG